MLNSLDHRSGVLEAPSAAVPALPRAVEVALRPRWVVEALALGVGLVVLGGVVGQLGYLMWPGFNSPTFSAATNLVGEFNIPATYNALLLLGVSVLLWWIGRLSVQLADRSHRIWTGLAGVAFYLTLDEYFAIHERLIGPVRNLLHLNGYLYYAWVIPYGLLAIVLAVALGRFLLRLPPQTRNGMLLSGFLYVAGALGMELLEAQITSLGTTSIQLAGQAQSSQLAMTVLIAVEELLEMAALVLLIATLLHFVQKFIPKAALHLRLKDG